MTTTDNLIVENFLDRFNQLKGISEFLKKITDDNFKIIQDVKSSDEEIDKLSSKFITFKKNEMSMTLLNQQFQSLVGRVVEYYGILKMANLPINITSEDEKFLNKFLDQKIDLYGIEKGQLIILDRAFHDPIMERLNTLKEGEAEQIFSYMKSFK